MTGNDHERAMHLLDTSAVQGIPEIDRAWLDGHLADCPACAVYCESIERTASALRGVTVPVTPRLLELTRQRVRVRAHELREQESRMRGLWISCALSWVLGVMSVPPLWWGFQWVGRHMALPDLAWQTAFVLWWVMPAAATAAVLAGLWTRAAKDNAVQENLRR